MSRLCFGLEISEEDEKDGVTREYLRASSMSSRKDEFKEPVEVSGQLVCNICRQTVDEGHVKSHVNKHIQTRALFACAYCNFKGRSTMAVRVHISWRHIGSKFGLSTVPSGLELIIGRSL